MSDAGLSDEGLMREVRAGDPSAFEALYDRHHRSVFTFLLRSLGDRRAAEEVLQETFLRVFTHRESYQPTATFKTWLFTIARNLVIDQLRGRGAAPELEAAEGLETVADPAATPLEQLEGAELGEKLEAALVRLSPAYREVLLLSRFAELNHQQIAEITGLSPSAVRVTLHRALRRLGAILASL